MVDHLQPVTPTIV